MLAFRVICDSIVLKNGDATRQEQARAEQERDKEQTGRSVLNAATPRKRHTSSHYLTTLTFGFENKLFWQQTSDEKQPSSWETVLAVVSPLRHPYHPNCVVVAVVVP